MRHRDRAGRARGAHHRAAVTALRAGLGGGALPVRFVKKHGPKCGAGREREHRVLRDALRARRLGGEAAKKLQDFLHPDRLSARRGQRAERPAQVAVIFFITRPGRGAGGGGGAGRLRVRVRRQEGGGAVHRRGKKIINS